MSAFIRYPLRALLRPRALCSSLALAFLAVPALATPGHTDITLSAQRAVAAIHNTSKGATLRQNDALVVKSAMVNSQGRTVVHAAQTYNGYRVWGSAALIHADAKGTAQLMSNSLQTDVTPVGSPTLTENQAIAVALKALSLKGPASKTTAELVVFPTKFHSGRQVAWDEKAKQYVIDRQLSTVTGKPGDAFVWAYAVHTLVQNRQDGMKDMSYVIDARTGAILNINNELRGLNAPNPPAQQPGDTAVKGIGHSQYSGDVTLDATLRADGTYSLIDKTRGTNYIPYLHDNYIDWMGTGLNYTDELGNPISIVGLQSIAQTQEGSGWDFVSAYHWFDKHATNEWGDGHQFSYYPAGNETSANGETAAVDAHYALATTWDFFKNIFGRDGLDGNGGSLATVVHAYNMFGYPDAFAMYGADFGVVIGDGTNMDRPNPESGGVIPADPNGRGSMTTLDVIGHELSHGVIDHTAGLMNQGAPGAIAEATADLFGMLIKAYAKRANPNDTAVPQTGLTWTIAEQTGPTPVRDMRKPSTIDYGRDNWYEGIEYTELGFQAGLMNRFFYFLSQGASSTAGANDYSPYLPQGMTGVGADRTAHIWYKALTEYLTPTATFEDAKTAALSAATDLYGPTSPEVFAVHRAFAAVNLDNAVDGVERVRISMAAIHPAGSIFNQDGSVDIAVHLPFVAMGQTVMLGAQVDNTADKRVEWKTGPVLGSRSNPGFQHDGGVITADGGWTPNNDWGFHAMSVYSKADPLQYAEGSAFVIDGDADADLEFDAIDLGALALSWGLDRAARTSHSMLHDNNGYGYMVDSFDVAAIVEAFINSFGGTQGPAYSGL